MLTQYWAEMFEGQVPTVVSDSAVAAQWARSAGLPFRYLDELGTTAPAAALVILAEDENYARQDILRRPFVQSRVLWFPLAAFDGSKGAVSYALGHLENMNFANMLAGHRAALKLIEGAGQVGFEGGRGTDLEVSFGPEVEFTMLTDLQVPVGDPAPLASFFEFETEIAEEQLAPGQPAPFVVTGVMRPSGALRAHAPGQFHADHIRVQQASQLVRRVAEAPTTVEVSDGQIRRIEIGGEDLAGKFGALAGRSGLAIREFAVGFYRAPEGSLDWRVNSPVNEGAQGIHIGIGDGCSGMHFDFICDDVISR
jgi:hypothetical protein